MTSTFSGALQPKKKAELQEICSALNINDGGTRDELQTRIKKHLDKNQAKLEDHPTFSGLFGRKRRQASIQPAPAPPSTRFALALEQDNKPSSRGARVMALDPIRESTPPNDMRDVSTMLKRPFTRGENSPSIHDSPRSPQRSFPTPSSLPPLPPSPTRSVLSGVVSRPEVENIVDIVRKQEESVIQSGGDMLLELRSFLSNSRNIWSLTAFLELLFILYSVIPWKSLQLSMSSGEEATGPSLWIVYPPLATFQTSVFWSVLTHWCLPTLLIPALFGTLISFTPTTTVSFSEQTSEKESPESLPPRTSRIPNLPFDPLTASIIRLAAQVAYPFPVLESSIQGIDVLGFRLRVLNASVGVAFAFAEMIAGAPAVFAKNLEQASVHNNAREQPRISGFPKRKALMAEDTVVDEVD